MAKRALLLACGSYTGALSELRSSIPDTERLEAILANPEIGNFETKIVLNPNLVIAQYAIQDVLESADATDLILIYLSGHGVKDAYGRFYLALPETDLRALAATALSGRFMREQLADTACKKLVFILDTCFAGAFSRDLVAKSVTIASGVPVELTESQGHAIISATSAVQYAFETMDGEPTSLFTKTICEGLETGSADVDSDGWVSLEDLFNFTVTKMREEARPQTPEMSVLRVTTPIFIARAATRFTEVNVDPEVSMAINSLHPRLRLAGARILAEYAVASDSGRRSWARSKLRALGNDNDRKVKRFVNETLGRPFRPHRPSSIKSLDGILPLIEGNQWVSISGKSLRAHTKRVADFAGFGDEHPVAKAVTFNFSDSMLDVITTDRYRFDWHRFAVLSSGPESFSALVSADDYPALLAQLPDDNVRIMTNGSAVNFHFHDRLLSVERVAGELPSNLLRFIQPIGPIISVETSSFLDAVESVTGGTPTPSAQPITLHMPSDSDPTVYLSPGHEETAPVEASVSAEGSMGGLKVILNSGYLLSALDVYAEKRVYIATREVAKTLSIFLLLNDQEDASHRHSIATIRPTYSKVK